MEALQLLSRNEMKKLIAGSSDPEFDEGGGCCLKCDQDSSECDYTVTSCSRSTAENKCGEDFDPMKTVCVC